MTNDCKKQETRNLEKAIEEFLINSGVNPKFKGFPYLCQAIKIKMENPNAKYMKDIYGTIAKKNRKSTENISNSIRNVVFRGYSNMSEGLKKRIWKKDFMRAFPSNSQFINGIAEFLSEIL